eukprot:11994937-Alexandrium_andersonii.AAC.1
MLLCHIMTLRGPLRPGWGQLPCRPIATGQSRAESAAGQSRVRRAMLGRSPHPGIKGSLLPPSTIAGLGGLRGPAAETAVSGRRGWDTLDTSRPTTLGRSARSALPSARHPSADVA